MRENFVETLVGVIVIAISVFFIAYGYSVTETQSSDNINISADFERIDGLTIGSDVRLSGVKIGTVTGTELDKESFSARVNMSLDSSIELPDDSSAKITSEGLLGGNYISVVPGGSDMALEPGGEIMFTQGSVDLMSLISQAMFSAGNSSNEPQCASPSQRRGDTLHRGASRASRRPACLAGQLDASRVWPCQALLPCRRTRREGTPPGLVHDDTVVTHVHTRPQGCGRHVGVATQRM